MTEEWRDWLELSGFQLREARAALAAGSYLMAVFAAHQIAEKALKAVWIVAGDGLPPRSHNLVELGEGVKAPPSILDSCRLLNPLYLASRYPDAANGNPVKNYTPAMASVFLDSAEEVLQWCSSQQPS